MESIRFSRNSSRYRQVVIWGYPLDTHTHSYIHAAFVKVFKHLDYPTHWISDGDDISGIDFRDTLIFVAGDDDVHKEVPIESTASYVVHNANARPFLEAGAKAMILQVYGTRLLENQRLENPDPAWEEINAYTYLHRGPEITSLHQPWATDLLPSEINIGYIQVNHPDKSCVWIGTYGTTTGDFETDSNVMPYMQAAEQNGIQLNMINPWSTPVSFEENRKLVHGAYLAPALQGKWQVQHQYIPCRIFKNISYGNIGITNNAKVNEIFDRSLVYDADPIPLFHKSLEARQNFDAELHSHLMHEVQQKHTYLNRVKQILECLEEAHCK